jgi:hypothetical protein
MAKRIEKKLRFFLDFFSFGLAGDSEHLDCPA